MDRFDAMTVLIATVETGSFSAAGRRLGMPLPTVSRKISELESHLGTRLLIRSTRKLVLTDAGVAFLAASRRIVEQLGEAERAAAAEYSEPRGELIVTAPVVFGRLHVLPIVAAFLAEYVEISVRLVLSDRTLHFGDDQIDAALRIGTLPDSSSVATRVGSVTRVACGSPSLFAKFGVPKSPGDLANLPSVLFDGLAGGPVWTFKSPGRKADDTLPARPRLSVNTAEAAVDAAIAGIGVTHVLSYQAAAAIADGRLQRVLRRFEPEPVPVSLMHAGRALLPLKTRRFLEFAAPRLRDVLGKL